MTRKDEEFNKLLSGIIGQVRQDLSRPRLQPSSVAPYFQFPMQPPQNTAQPKPSVASRIIDVLSRGIYSTANFLKEAELSKQSGAGAIEQLGEGVKGFGRGLAGKDKTLFGETLDVYGMEKGPARTALGFTGDVLLDPLTYAGGAGLFSKMGLGGRSAQKSLGGLREVQNATEAADRNLLSIATGVNPTEVARAQNAAMGRLQSPKPVAETPLSPTKQILPTSYEFPRVQLPGAEQIRRESAIKSLQEPTIAVPETLRGVPIEEALPKFLRNQRDATRKLDISAPTAKVGVADEVAEAGARETAEIMAGRLSTKPMPPPQISTGRADRTRELAENFLKKNKHKSINEAGQEDLLRILINDVNKTLSGRGVKNVMSSYFEPVRYSSAFEMVRLAEEVIERAGRKFEVAGKPLKMSQVMNEVGPSNLFKNDKWRSVLTAFATGNLKGITHEPLRKELGKILGNRARIQADVTDKSLAEAIKRGKELEQNAIAARATQNKDALADALTSIQKEAGAVTGDALASKKFLKKILEPDESIPQTAIQIQARSLMKQSITGKVDVQNIIKSNKAVYEYLGGNPKVLGSIVGNNRGGEAIMTKFATWWGAKDLRPFQREALDTARIAAAAFTHAWSPLVRAAGGPKAPAIVNGWLAATGRKVPADALEAKISQQFKDAMEKLLHSPGLTDDAARGNTVALRTGVTMDEFNEELAKFGGKYQFTNAEKVVDKYGVTHNFSKNADWLKSWTAMDVEEPVELLYRVHHALQRITRKNALLEDAAARWGSAVKTSEFVTKINHPRIEDFWFPKEISEQMNTLLKSTFDPANYRANNEMLRLYDKTLGAFKSGVTIYNPSHHIRNAIGDIWLSGLDGVISPAPYMMSIRVLSSQRGRYNSMMNLMEVTDPQAIKRAMTRPGDTILTTKAGQQLTAEQIYTAAFNKGILLRASEIEDIIETGGRLVPNLPITQGRIREAAHGASELRDHYIRLAHFIHVLKTSKTKHLDDLFSEAGQRVKRYHPDGMDMTEFERKVMRRLIPFYSWARKSTPLIVEAMVMRPSLVTAYPKAQAELQSMFGIEPVAGMGDPFPADQMFPEWIRAKGIGPLGTPDGLLSQFARNEPPGYVMLNPSTPFNDAAADYEDPLRFLKNSISPMIGVPASLWSGQDPLGIPIDNKAEYVAKQAIPPLATAGRVTGQTRPNEPWSPEQLIRWLTASGLIGTGPYKRQGAFEEQERRVREAPYGS